MARKTRNIMMMLFTLIVSGIVWVILKPAVSVSDIRSHSRTSSAPLDGQIAITPIPLSIKLDERKVVLGRRLFHDPRLSADNTISCAHCHNLSNGGMDSLPRSFGIGGKVGEINSPTIFNSGFNATQFWDGHAETLEDQVDFPMLHTCEMGATWDDVVAKIKHDHEYTENFEEIYPQGIDQASIRNAIATFEESLITPNSRFDRYLRGEQKVLNKEELAGFELFKNLGCISCHQGMNLGGNMFEKFGLFDDYFAKRGNIQTADYGRYNITGHPEDKYEFRVPPLRNIALTAPYFHDGSAATLNDAVAIMGQYQLGVKLRDDEVDKIVRFLHTLTGVYEAEAYQ